MQNFKQKRLNRAKQTRLKIAKIGRVRLTVHRTNQHIYAQLIDDQKRLTLTSASTLEADVKKEVAHGSNIKAAEIIGKRIADKAKKIGVEQIAFDRSGYRYHGRVKALAEAARASGLQF